MCTDFRTVELACTQVWISSCEDAGCVPYGGRKGDTPLIWGPLCLLKYSETFKGLRASDFGHVIMKAQFQASTVPECKATNSIN